MIGFSVKANMKNIVGLMTFWWAVDLGNPKKSISEGPEGQCYGSSWLSVSGRRGGGRLAH